MGKARLEAFSDGVIAIIITIMVLELKAPHRASLAALWPLWPVFLSYALSFIYVGIYWNNHHHLFQAATCVNGRVLWANLHLLFWLSLIPFATDWMGETRFAAFAVAAYGAILFLSGVAYTILVKKLIALEGKDSALAISVGKDRKGLLSLLLYLVGLLATTLNAWLGFAIYGIVAVIWFIPDPRIARHLASNPKSAE